MVLLRARPLQPRRVLRIRRAMRARARYDADQAANGTVYEVFVPLGRVYIGVLCEEALDYARARALYEQALAAESSAAAVNLVTALGRRGDKGNPKEEIGGRICK